MRNFRKGSVFFLLLFLSGFLSAAPDKTFQFELTGTIGKMSGDVTYQIGGTTTIMGWYSYEQHFPLSELSFPLEIWNGNIGFDFRFKKNIEAKIDITMNLSSEAGKLKDSDWLSPGRLDVFSTSDTDFSGNTVDVSGAYWFELPKHFHLALGAGYLHQKYSWDASNLDQWYPSAPWEEHYTDTTHTVISYESVLNMFYLEAKGKFTGNKFSVTAGLAYSPNAGITDKDDHKLRYILAKTDADGDATRLFLQGRYEFNEKWFIVLQIDQLKFSAEGTEKDTVYDGESYGSFWTIDHEIESTQKNFSASAGYRF
ncbi:MAG: omptin family outer membrane protease [Candidatus Aureabacteria bacterium]|nr:omptin family outer membrane protease [Candidatus Auribacterota bacterium]